MGFSTADGGIPTSEKGAANGVAELDANSQVPLTRVPSAGLLNDAVLAFVSATSVTIGTAAVKSSAVDSTDVLLMEFTGTLTAAITASGAGGLDTGVEAADTWYAVHVIGDTTGANSPAALLSLSATAPTQPAGYDVFRRVGWVRNDASSDLLKFFQRGRSRDRTIYYDEAVNATRVLNMGTATVFTAVDCSGFAPPTSEELVISLGFNPNSAPNRLRLRPTGSTVIEWLYRPGAAIVDGMEVPGVIMLCDTSQSIDYRGVSASDTATIRVSGYKDEL